MAWFGRSWTRLVVVAHLSLNFPLRSRLAETEGQTRQTHACTHVRTQTRTHTHARHARTHIPQCVCRLVRTHTRTPHAHLCMQVGANTRMFARAPHTHTRACRLVRIHARATHTHTHTHRVTEVGEEVEVEETCLCWTLVSFGA